jgi:superfamily II DNA or RNA helicase
MNIHVGNLDSRIETDNPELLKALYELYSFNVPGARYSPAYRRRQWDGKTHFISKSGVFKTGLLSRLLADLKKIDCEPEIIGAHKTSCVPAPNSAPNIEGFTYYDYQEELIWMGLDNMRGIIKSPTGSGKTLIMAGGICFGEGYIYGDIMLCTVQSIERILDTHLEEAEVLMVDECHEFCNGKTTLAALRSFPNALYRLGFTATPPSDDIPRYNLEGALGAVLQSVGTADLVDDGKLTKPIIQLINRGYDASGLDEDKAFLDIYEDYIVNNESRNNIIKEIVNDIRKTNKKARILVLTKSLSHGRQLENLIGGSVEFLEGDNSIRERYDCISRFRGCNESSVLIGTKILQTGVNIEEITHFINARGMKSEIATLQALGRALRRHDSKDVVYIYDFLDKEKYLSDHSVARKRHYEKEGHTVKIL